MQTDDIAGKANCGCVYHAEEGIPCPHDIALAEKSKQTAFYEWDGYNGKFRFWVEGWSGDQFDMLNHIELSQKKTEYNCLHAENDPNWGGHND